MEWWSRSRLRVVVVVVAREERDSVGLVARSDSDASALPRLPCRAVLNILIAVGVCGGGGDRCI